jgi:hypothetical protein
VPHQVPSHRHEDPCGYNERNQEEPTHACGNTYGSINARP